MAAIDYFPSVELTSDDFEILEGIGRIKLSTEHRKEILQLLREYEYLRHLKEARHLSSLRADVLKLANRFGDAIKIIESLPTNPGHIWAFLATEADVDDYDEEIRRLRNLKHTCEQFFQKYKKSSRKPDTFLETCLGQLQSTFRRAGGKIKFLDFACAALCHLPRPYRPHSQRALGARLERIRSSVRRRGPRTSSWIGDPHPILARIASRRWSEPDCSSRNHSHRICD
jgi:hypothetical protein